MTGIDKHIQQQAATEVQQKLQQDKVRMTSIVHAAQSSLARGTAKAVLSIILTQ